VNAALLMLSLTAGGDPAPGCCGAAPAAVAPAGGCCDAKPGLLGRLRGRPGHRAKADCCDPCGGPTNLLDALKARRARHHPPAADCGGCGPAAAPAPAAPAPTTPADPPKDMPRPKDAPAPKGDAPKELPKAGNPGAVVVPPLPVTPVSSPKLSGANSPY
jgi:hypothetical protein